jgi:hypothetical protein
MTNENALWYVEVEQRQKFGSMSREFVYSRHYVANSEEEAREAARKRFFWTEEKFFEVYYEDNCPPPNAFTLENKITRVKKAEVEGYRVILEERQ